MVKEEFYPTHSDMNDNWMTHFFDEPTLWDCEDKYLVIKVEAGRDKLTTREQRTLARYLLKIGNKNHYWVVNKDEPYANLVKDLIFKSSSTTGDSGHKVVR